MKNYLNHFFLPAISFFIISSAIPDAQAAVSPLNFTVNMSEPVIVNTTGGTPTIAIDIGGVPNTATFASGSGTSALTFTYTPVTGDVDLDGIAISSPVNLNGGTIKDTAGNDANLTFTPPVTTGIKVNYPSLSLDFINNRYSANGNVRTSLSTFLSDVSGTFTRASVGTYYDAAGVLQTASNNTPRFDYDPVAHTLKGILIEASSINLFTYSDQFDNPVWSLQNSTLSANTLTAPDGTMTADTWTRSSTASSYFGQSISKSASALTYTETIYVKKNIGNYFALRMQGAYPARADIVFNLNTGAISTAASATSSFTSASGSIQNVGNGWYRVSLRATSDTHNNIRLYGSFNSNGATLDGTDSASNSSGYIWGAQFEQAAFASTYIPTTTAAVTRAADSFVIPTGSWFNTTLSTLYGYGSVVNLNGAATFADINNNNWSERFQIRIDSGPHYSGIITKANVVQTGVGSGTAPINTPIKMVMAAKANDAVLYANGASRGTSSSLAMPTAQTQIRIGAVSNGAEYMNGTLQTIKYYPKRVDNAQLLLMTQ